MTAIQTVDLTDTPNQGRVKINANFLLLRGQAPTYNVKLYGALGDDATSTITAETANIQSCLDAANTAGGGLVYFPEGKYRVNAALLVGDNTTVVMAAGGSIRPSNSAVHVFQQKPGATKNIAFENVTVDGILLNSALAAAGNAIQINSVDNVQITGSHFVNMGRSAVALEGCTNLRVEDNHFADIGANQYVSGGVNIGTGLTLYDCVTGVVGGNTFDTMWQMAVFCSQNGNGGCRYIVINANVINGCGDNGIRLNNGTLYNASTAPTADNIDGTNHCIVSNNILTDIAVDGIRCSGYNNTIIGNDIRGVNVVPVTGIKIDQGSNHKVTNNSVSHAYTGIYVRLAISKHGTDGQWDVYNLKITNNNLAGCQSGIATTQAAGDQVFADSEISNNGVNLTLSVASSGHGIILRYGQRIKINDNILRSTAYHAIAVLPSHSGITNDITVNGNVIYDGGAVGIALFRILRLQAHNNRVYPRAPSGTPLVGWNGITLNDVSGFSLSGNYVYGAGAGGLSLANSEHGVISHNVIANSQLADAGGATGYAAYGGITLQKADYVATLTAGAAPGATTLTLNDTDALEEAYSVSITLDVGGPFVTTIASIDSSTQVTLAAVMPSAAGIGKTLTMAGLYATNNILVSNNQSYDAGGGLQLYGLVTIGACTAIRVMDNTFAGNITSDTLYDATSQVTDGTSNLLEVVNNASGSGILRVRTFGVSGLTTNAPFFRGMAARGTLASPAAVQSGDALFRVSAQGYNGSGYATGSNMLLVADETWNNTSNGSYIAFLTAINGTTTASTRLKIGSSGDLTQTFSTPNTTTVAEAVALQTTSTGTPGAGFGHSLTNYLKSSTTVAQQASRLETAWDTATHATRKAHLALLVSDAAGEREGIRVATNGSAPMLGFYAATAIVKPTVTGSRGANAALASLLTQLASLGLVIDSSS